jgi:hypothetical protein
MYGSGYVDALGGLVDGAGRLIQGAGNWYEQNKNNTTKIKDGKIVIERSRSSALPNLPRSVNSNLAAYDPSVRTPVGGGNAAQTVTPAPETRPKVEPPASGRDTAPPQGGADTRAKGTQTSPSSRMEVLYNRLTNPNGDFAAIPFRFEGNAPTLPGAGNPQQANTQYAAQDVSQATTHYGDVLSPYLKGYSQDANDRYNQLAYAYNHGIQGDQDFAKEGANPQAGSSPVPDAAESNTEVAFPGAQEHEGNPKGKPSGIDWMKPRANSGSNRSFLDYPGGSMMALRALEASQGTMKQNGVTYGRDESGKWVALSGDAAKALKADRSSVATVDFVRDHQFKPQATTSAEQPDVEVPSISAAPVDYDAATGSTPAIRLPEGAIADSTLSIQTQDVPFEVKEPQVFLSKKLQQYGLD